MAQPSLHTFGGPIKFYELAVSLHTVAIKTKGSDLYNRNVVFAASSLRSASILIPLACEVRTVVPKSFIHNSIYVI